MRLLVRQAALALLVTAFAALASAAQTPAAEARRDIRLDGPAPIVFQQLGRLYGIRVRVDPALPPRPLRLRLGESDFTAALRIAAQLAGAFWVEEPGGVFVAEDSQANRLRYQRQVMKTFVLPGRTPEELTETVRMLRELLDMARLQPDSRSSTFTVRDTPRRLAVADALLDQLLAEPGEVWVDVQVLEVSRRDAQALGFVPPDRIILQQAASGGIPLPDAGALPENYAVVLPGTTLRLEALRSRARAARHLSLRAREGEEATLFSGERFPIIFTTFSFEQQLRDRLVPPIPAMRFEELGVRVTLRPRLHGDGELTLAFKLDQKALAGRSLNDIPVLSNRSFEQQVRLRAGETLLLAGFRSDDRRATALDAALRRDTAAEATELIVLLTPRIVRQPRPERLVLRTLYVGTESEFAPASSAPAPAVQPQPPRPPAVQPPAPPQPPPQPPEEEEEDEEDR